jgi:hypothetical protein
VKPLDPTVSFETASLLADLGYSDEYLDQLSEGAKDDARERALAWVTGIVSNRGTDRAKRVRDCGRLFPALLPSGEVVILARPCKDRACPRCMVSRAARLGGQLRNACEIRAREGSILAFVTLTQKKRHSSTEGAGGALNRLLKSWARLTRSSSRKRNARLRSMFRGGVRGIECVWSGRGSVVWTPRAKGQDLTDWKETRRVSHRVRYNGWHAHAHCVVELTPPAGYALGEPLEDFEHELREVWAWASKGACPEQGVDVQPVQLRNVGQVAKYVTKPFELPPEKARELFEAIHSRRMLDGFGSWKSWRSWAPEDESPYAGASLAATSLASLAYRYGRYESKGRGSKDPAPVAFKRWTQCKESGETSEKTVAVLSIREIHKRMRDASEKANFAAQARWADKAGSQSDQLEAQARRAARRDLQSAAE